MMIWSLAMKGKKYLNKTSQSLIFDSGLYENDLR